MPNCSTVCRKLFSGSLILVVALFLLLSHAAAGQEPALPFEGYITDVHLPGGFDVNGKHVAVSSATCYGLMKTYVASNDGSLRDEVKVGAYVRILGSYDGHRKQTNATTVLFRDDWSQKLGGLGVITRVESSGAEPVYHADGYTIRVPATAETSFHGDVKTLPDVGPNTWVRYGGKRDKDGVLIASKIKFLNPRKKPMKNPDRGVFNGQFEPPDLGAHKDGGIKMAKLGP